MREPLDKSRGSNQTRAQAVCVLAKLRLSTAQAAFFAMNPIPKSVWTHRQGRIQRLLSVLNSALKCCICIPEIPNHP